MSALGERIRIARTMRDMTQEELAQAVGTSKQNIYKYEMGIITNIPIDRVELLGSTLHVSPAWLMGWSAEIFGEKRSYSDKVRQRIRAELDNYDPADIEAARSSMNIHLLEKLAESSNPVAVDDAIEVADILGLSLEELLGINKPAETSELETFQFIQKFRDLDSENKKRILDLMQALAETRKQNAVLPE